MLPQLQKKKSLQGANQRNSQPRIISGQIEFKESTKQPKSVSAKKVRTGGGFMKSNIAEQIKQRTQLATQKLIQQQNFNKITKFRRAQGLSAEIKLIEKKIKECQKKLQQDRKKQKLQGMSQYNLAQQATRDKDQPQYNFQKVVQKQLQMQGYNFKEQQNQYNFDYLTNPRLKPGQQQQIIQQPIQQKPLIIESKAYNINEGIEKLQRFYQNSLKKKFQRRQMFPHQACRRKTPKLYITQKTNALNKYGRAQNQAEHLFRVLTKQTTPQQIYPTIPNFAVVKDNLSKNIVAYLGDYKPFLDKTKQGSQKQNDKKEYQQQNKNQQDKPPATGEGNKSKVGIRIKQNLQVSAKSKNKTNQKQQVLA